MATAALQRNTEHSDMRVKGIFPLQVASVS